jgi:NhaP-type Na+/H+ or K+/H+ antiporter
MTFGTPIILLILSGIVILSYIFNLISKKTNIPSVLMLIGAGIAIKHTTVYYWEVQPDVMKLVKVLGAVGLIMIVLEAALDLKINRSKLKLIGDSFFSALFIFLISAFGIGYLVMQWLNVSFEKSFLYAVPLSIISSAIVIPSTSHLIEEKKEFIIYESSFSDILGILVFNYMILENVMSLKALGTFTFNVGLGVLLSIVATIVLVYMVAAIRINLKFFLIFAVLSFLYALGEMIHLPALLIVLVFGLVINNTPLIIRGRIANFVNRDSIDSILDFMKSITAETSFLIRTFFFILFGYTINLNVLLLPEVWQIGLAIIAILLSVRFFYLRIILKTNLLPELFLMPRGLVTILLFYSIPSHKSIGSFNEGILFFVVAVSSVLMMIGLMFFSKGETGYLEKSEEAI